MVYLKKKIHGVFYFFNNNQKNIIRLVRMCSKNQLVLPLLLPSLPLSYVSSTRPFNPISSASDSYLYELELTSKRPSLGADWTKPQSFTGQFSVTNPRRCHQAEVVSAADHQRQKLTPTCAADGNHHLI